MAGRGRKRMAGAAGADDGSAPCNATRMSKDSHAVLADRRATRSMTTDAAVKAVFNTSELLEHILVHLPVPDIITVQRVSQQLRDAVKASPGIKKKLFLSVSRKGTETWRRLPGPETADHHYAYARTTEAPDYRIMQDIHPDVRSNFLVLSDHNSLLPRSRSMGAGCMFSAGCIAPSVLSRGTSAPRVPLLNAMKHVLLGQAVPPMLAHMRIIDEPVIEAILFLLWKAGTKSGMAKADVRTSSGLTFGSAMEAMRDAISTSNDNLTDEKLTAAEMVQGQAPSAVEVEGIAIFLEGVCVSSEEEREGCLPLA